MKGIQVSIDVSESEIVPKAFQRPAVSGVRARGASASVCSLAARRKISSHKQGGRRRKNEEEKKKGRIKKKRGKCVKNVFWEIFFGGEEEMEGGKFSVQCPGWS